jgi:adenylate cyclase
MAVRNVISFATLSPIGFTEDDVAKLATLPLWLGAVFEAIEHRNVAVMLLKTSVGGKTADQILRGLIKRGGGETIRATIWLSDLRDFTAMNERLEPSEVLSNAKRLF